MKNPEKLNDPMQELLDKMHHDGAIDFLRAIDDRTREERVDRYLEVNRSIAIPITDFTKHFIDALKECINLYRDGYYIATVMLTQSVNEGLLKLVAERKSIQYKSKGYLLEIMMEQNILPKECINASKQIYNSYRNDVHHMNLKVSEIDFPSLAKKNIHNLMVVENEIFYTDISEGKLIPKYPEFWFT